MSTGLTYDLSTCDLEEDIRLSDKSLNKTKVEEMFALVSSSDMCETIESKMAEREGKVMHEDNSRTGLAEYASQSSAAKKFPQFLATIIATLAAFSAGTTISWSSAAIPILKQDGVSDEAITWISSLITLGAFLGAIPAGMLANMFGRKRLLLLVALPSLLAWGVVAHSLSVEALCVARFVAGFSIGVYSVAIPMYVAELAEPRIRGTLGTMFQLQITAGILFQYIIGVSENWQLISLIPATIPIIFFIAFCFMPESPVYLTNKKQTKEAKQALQWFRGGEDYDVEDELTKIQDQLLEAEKNKASIADLVRSKAPSRALVIALGLMIFQQLSGINAVIFYTQSIFESSKDLNLPSYGPPIIVGVVMVIATYLSTILIDRAGRRILLLISCSVMAVCLAVFAVYFTLDHSPDPNTYRLPFIVPLLSVVVYITVFSLGFGPIPWMMLGELFTPKMKGAASSISAAFNWMLAFTVTKFFGNLEVAFGLGPTFGIFAVICILGTLFVFVLVPETKGKDMEEIQIMLGEEKVDQKMQYAVNDDLVVIDIKK